ncbi:MAG: hypothetical protein U9N38_03640 [Thermodesulfobacteriota bacterium]|nr:hypothetical protein [Thermodesulfobacteriota bacterium]
MIKYLQYISGERWKDSTDSQQVGGGGRKYQEGVCSARKSRETWKNCKGREQIMFTTFFFGMI